MDPEEYETDKMGRATKAGINNDNPLSVSKDSKKKGNKLSNMIKSSITNPKNTVKSLIGKTFKAGDDNSLNPEKTSKNVRAGKRLSHTVDPE